MRKTIDSVGPRPEKKKVEPLVTHKAGEVFRPKGATLRAGEQAKPKGYVDPKTLEKKPNILSEIEHKTAQQHRKQPRKKMLIIVGGVAVVLVVLLLISIPVINSLQRYWQKQNDKKYINVACTVQNQDLMNKAIADVNSQDLEALQTASAKIKALDHYNLDQNCLAIISWSALLRGDTDTARSSIDAIRAVYRADANRGVVGVIYTSDPDKLKQAVDQQSAQVQQWRDNNAKFRVQEQ